MVWAIPAEAPTTTQARAAHGVPRLERVRLATADDEEVRSRDIGWVEPSHNGHSRDRMPAPDNLILQGSPSHSF